MPFMVWCNLTLHDAIGTSAAIDFPIAVAGSLGISIMGWELLTCRNFRGLHLSPGAGWDRGRYCSDRAFRVGLDHSLPVGKLKRVFALFLLLMGTRMLISLF
jgi:uncharacterized membrane protein YfcA